MREASIRYNAETGKPVPISLREFYLMDRKESKVFLKALNRHERKDFELAYNQTMRTLPLEQRRQLAREKVAKLSGRDNRSLGDKLELSFVKLHLRQIMLPEKKPIFLRKLRTRQSAMARVPRHQKSPYLIFSL